MADEDTKVYLSGEDGMASRLGRAEHTLRQWIRENCLPRALKPQREGGRQKIFWTEDQVEPLRRWADDRASRRGWQPAH